VFAERLRREIAGRNITQQDLATALGRTQTAVSYWCAGKRQPGFDDLCELADYFGTTTDYFLGRVAHA
jgi:transcriptional regulator with XRE-family HTH domain